MPATSPWGLFVALSQQCQVLMCRKVWMGGAGCSITAQ